MQMEFKDNIRLTIVHNILVWLRERIGIVWKALDVHLYKVACLAKFWNEIPSKAVYEKSKISYVAFYEKDIDIFHISKLKPITKRRCMLGYDSQSKEMLNHELKYAEVEFPNVKERVGSNNNINDVVNKNINNDDVDAMQLQKAKFSGRTANLLS
ncbi:hypothetical protein ROZALSC1DRAFT_21021 [Rozella allomycis CSF55]|uniref:Uncharacterized protein n=1 Tax=Rozella allomycis (strain CSF55) TaxID=988480 RepID=A0A4P9YN01_ROZAC|nr:hypothetical protein ROZALSC1DRAFT_21021 [Rozella allomycis CSF55]